MKCKMSGYGGKIEGVAKSHCNKNVNDEYGKFYELNCINQIKVETEKKETLKKGKLDEGERERDTKRYYVQI